MKKCTNCGATCQNGLMKGNGWIEFILWLCYIIPGLVYSIWRRSGEPSICPACKKDTLIPYIENVRNQSTNQRVEVECEWCAEPILANAKVCKHCGKEVNPQKFSAPVIPSNSITTAIPQSTTPVNNKIVTEKANKRELKFIGALIALIALIFIVNILKSNDKEEAVTKIQKSPVAVQASNNAKKTSKPVTPPAISSPTEICGLLNNSGLATRGWKNSYGNEFGCSSPYKDIGNGQSLPNNLAYYVTGARNSAAEAKLVLNINNKSQSQSAHSALLSASETLSTKITKESLPKAIRSAISNGSPAQAKIAKTSILVKRDNWPTGQGYEIHVIFKIAR